MKQTIVAVSLSVITLLAALALAGLFSPSLIIHALGGVTPSGF